MTQELLKLAIAVLGSKQDAERWLATPKSALGAETPSDYASSPKRMAEVKNVLNGIEHGVFW